MRYRGLVYLAIVVLAATLFAIPAQTQEDQVPPAKDESAGVKEVSIYGEVKSVDQTSNSMSVQYYDYDADEEMTAGVILDKDSKIENAAALSDIKQGDWVDVTYKVSEGKNVAMAVKLEKEEEEEAPGQTNEDASDEKSDDY